MVSIDSNTEIRIFMTNLEYFAVIQRTNQNNCNLLTPNEEQFVSAVINNGSLYSTFDETEGSTGN